MPTNFSASLIRAWSRVYTRGLSDSVASTRRAEIESDLHEQTHRARANGHSNRRTQLALLSRAVRGTHADLSWRLSTQGNATPSATSWPVTADRLFFVSVGVVTGTLAAFGLFVVLRLGLGVTRGQIVALSANSVLLVTLTLVTVCGLLLLRHERTRLVALVWLAVPAWSLIPVALLSLLSTSTTVAALYGSMAGWRSIGLALPAGLVLFYLAAAIWWWPTPAPRKAVTE